MTAPAGGPAAPGCGGAAGPGHRLIDLRHYADARGCLAVAEYGQEVGFLTRRAYFMYAAGAGSARGAHAHRKLEQFIVALQGSFDITVNNGSGECTHRLSGPTRALYVGPMVWRDMAHFSADSVCFVLASEPYDGADYIRDYECFRKELRG
jgi:dTDP-4-dehydrorhamnose 3,5-epimerase-like enzyme